MQARLIDDSNPRVQLGSRAVAALRCAVLMFFTVLLAGCASSVQLTSGWKSNEIRIDGMDQEWRDALTYVRTSDAFIGMKNDADNLYVCFKTSNRQKQIQMLAFGLTTWFDSEGKKEKTFGIHFPVGGQLQALRLLSVVDPSEELQQMFRMSQRDLEVVGSAIGGGREITDQEAAGIRARLGYSQEALVYELEIPLRKTADHPFAVGVADSQMVSVGFETGDISTTVGGQPSSARSMGTPSGGRRGGRSRGGGSSTTGGMQNEPPQPLNLWTTVKLASGEASLTK
jgi:hypothetical protein